MTTTITVIRGDGIGPEIMDATLHVLDAMQLGLSYEFADAGMVAVVPLVSPYRADRDRVRQRVGAAGIPFVEVFVDTPLEVCEQRDPKGLYAKARAGQLTGMTGIDDPYEPPTAPELRLVPGDGDPAAQAALVLEQLGRASST